MVLNINEELYYIDYQCLMFINCNLINLPILLYLS